MSLLIDTNVLSDLRRRKPGSEPLFRWRDAAQREFKYVSAISIIEIEFGILQAESRNMPHAAALRSWLTTLLAEFTGAVISVDIEVALATARLQRIRTVPTNDAIIAATALVHDFTIVTRNEHDFAGLGVRIINPWSLP